MNSNKKLTQKIKTMKNEKSNTSEIMDRASKVDQLMSGEHKDENSKCSKRYDDVREDDWSFIGESEKYCKEDVVLRYIEVIRAGK
tara:strand:+ start:3152 stop:3406 length:255 start_codon:yes stop_codon:yes gene_type:complete